MAAALKNDYKTTAKITSSAPKPLVLTLLAVHFFSNLSFLV
jgi:hypothetical protein